MQAALNQIIEGTSLDREQAARIFQIIMNGGATPSQMAAFLVALRMKGESAEEIAGAVQAVRAKASRVEAPPGAIDVCGTGGDGKNLPNISTATAFVVAGCGVPVAKHGNRAVSSRSGSADVLAALGVNTQMSATLAAEALHDARICFLLAPLYHPAMRHVSPIRQELGTRTIFNIIGPLTNPARVTRQLIGVYNRELAEKMIMAADVAGLENLWVVHSEDGLDELSIADVTHVWALENGNIRRFKVAPETAGIERGSLDELAGGDAKDNARQIQNLLWGEVTPFRRIVLLNAAAALVVAGKAGSLAEGAELAAEAIEDGCARAALDKLVTISNKEL